jgi:L-asparaginase
MEIIRLNTAAPANADRSALMIYTGGTLGMIQAGPKSPLKPFRFDHLLENIPELKSLKIDIGVYSYTPPLDSSHIGPQQWLELARIIADNYENYDGFVILHGTDTMAYTASCLSYLFEGLKKPVILTGAQLPIGIPRTDARNNIITALEIASSYHGDKPMVPEVAIYFDYVLFRGNRTSKIESNQFDAYRSENYPPLAKAGVKIAFTHPFIHEPGGVKFKTYEHLDSNIGVIKVYPGMGENLNFLLQNQNTNGLILETFGSGSIPKNEKLVKFLKDYIRGENPVLNISQCPGGEVEQGKYEASRVLNEIGVLDGKDMTFEAGLTKMMFCLGNFSDYRAQKKALISPLRGEMKDVG